MAQQRHHLRIPDRFFAHSEEVEAARGRDPADDRELWPAALVDKPRRLADRRPSLRGAGDEGEPPLVDEDYYGLASAGFFLQRGRERCGQFLPCSKFFSRARRRGRCHESPWRLSKRHIAVPVDRTPHAVSVTWRIRGMVQRSVENP